MSYIGNTKIGRMFLGATEIAKAYLGSTLVFQKGGQPQPQQHTIVLYPSGYDSVDKSYYNINNPANAYEAADSSDTNYCGVGLARGAGAETYCYFTFDTSAIPASATIDSISCVARVQIQTQNTSYVASKGAKMCSGTTEKTAAVSVTTSAANRTFSMGTWSRAELNDIRIKLYATRGSSNTSQGYNIRLYGATLTITYTA